MGENLCHAILGTSESVVAAPNGSIICGGVRTNQTTNVQNFTFQCNIFQVDSLGNKEWEYLSPISAGLRDAANDMLLLDDGSLIVASGIGHEQQHPSVNEVFFDRYIFKLNPQHQIEWELTFPDPSPNWASKTSNLIRLTDDSGYILTGVSFNPLLVPPYSNIMGWIAKISPEGDSIWSRRYEYVNDLPIGQTIYDTKLTEDGGLIICGQSFNYDDNALYPQQGWLLKLDEYGCLVPGCHLNDATEEEPLQAEPEIVIYPNPTSDYLNFLVKAPTPASKATIRIINGEGKLIKELDTNRFDQTFILPLWDWANGVYWLQVVDEGKIVVSKQFQIIK